MSASSCCSRDSLWLLQAVPSSGMLSEPWMRGYNTDTFLSPRLGSMGREGRKWAGVTTVLDLFRCVGTLSQDPGSPLSEFADHGEAPAPETNVELVIGI